MAVYNEMLVGRFNRALQKLTGIKGGPPVRTLGSEILPVFPLFWGNDVRYLESWQLFGAMAAISAVAAQIPIFHFRNPVGSNVIAVITKLTLAQIQSVASQEQVIVEGPNPSTAADDQGSTPNFCRFDARGQQNPSMKLSFGTAASDSWPGNNRAWFLAEMQQTSTIDLILTDSQEFTLLPGDAFRCVDFNTNTPLSVSVMWRERFLEDSERT